MTKPLSVKIGRSIRLAVVSRQESASAKEILTLRVLEIVLSPSTIAFKNEDAFSGANVTVIPSYEKDCDFIKS